MTKTTRCRMMETSRIYRSYIVSLENTTYVEKSAVHILEEVIPIGSLYKNDFFQKWAELGILAPGCHAKDL